MTQKREHLTHTSPKDRSYCEVCGKQGFRSRKAAKKYARRKGWPGLSAYACEENITPYRWHIGHLPPYVKDGRYGREILS